MKRKARKQNKKEEYKRLEREIRTKIRSNNKEWVEKECSKILLANEQRQTNNF